MPQLRSIRAFIFFYVFVTNNSDMEIFTRISDGNAVIKSVEVEFKEISTLGKVSVLLLEG